MIKLCECGCGQPTNIIQNTNKNLGYKKGEYHRFVVGHNNYDKHHSLETKQKISEKAKGRFKGKTYEEICGVEKAKELKELRRKMQTGIKRSQKIREKMSKAQKGHPPTPSAFKKGHTAWNKGLTAKTDNRVLVGKNASFYGKHHTEKNKEKIGKLHTGNKYLLGRKFSDEHRRNISKSHKGLLIGKNHPNYKGGITPLYRAIGSCAEYRQWREAIYKRDNFTCQKCGDNKGRNLQAHHNKKSFIELLAEFLQKYKQYNLIKDQSKLLKLAKKYKPFWTAEGITYCKKCHTELHKKLREEK